MTATCPIHNLEMTEKEGKFGSFWSHKMPDGSWCNGKPPKQSNGFESKPTSGRDSGRIEMQHSQEMAIRFLELQAQVEPEKMRQALQTHSLSELVARYTDHFRNDLNR